MNNLTKAAYLDKMGKQLRECEAMKWSGTDVWDELRNLTITIEGRKWKVKY